MAKVSVLKHSNGKQYIAIMFEVKEILNILSQTTGLNLSYFKGMIESIIAEVQSRIFNGSINNDDHDWKNK